MRLMATHGITENKNEFLSDDASVGEWYYEQKELGYNFRMTEMQAALIISQINRLTTFKEKRRKIHDLYNEAFSNIDGLIIPAESDDVNTCWHLYVLRIDEEKIGCSRKTFFEALSSENIQPQVHYIPVYRQPYYQKLGYNKDECPICERIYQQILSLPLYPAMTDEDVNDVIEAVSKICEYFRRNKR